MRRVLLSAFVAAGALGGCGDPSPEFATAPPGAAISYLDIDGHSVAFGSGADEDGPGGTGFASQVARTLDLEENNQAVPGATVQESGIRTDGWGKVLRSLPRAERRRSDEPLPRMALLMYGANDVALFGPDLSQAEHAYRAVISRHRSSAVYEAGDGGDRSIIPDSRWDARDVGPGEASGDSVLTTSRPGVVTIEVEDGLVPEGGTVALGFTQPRGTSARYEVQVDGKRAGVLDASGPLAPKQAPYVPEATAASYVLRIEDFPAGKHTITVAADRVDGEAMFDYWQAEPRDAEPVVLIKQYRLPTPKRPAPSSDLATNADYVAINRLTDSLAKEFGSRVIAVDTDRVIERSPDLLFSDNIHLNQRGQDAVARAVLQAIARSPFASELDEPRARGGSEADGQQDRLP